jgi:hypothetical protein
MANNTALVLGQEYSFVDLKLTIFGVELFSCTDFTAEETQEKTNNYGNGNRPFSRGRKQKEYNVSIDLSLKDVERLKVLSPTGSLTDLPVGTAIALLDNGVDAIHSFTLPGFEFNSDGIKTSQGDTESRRTYDCICADIISKKVK